MNRPDIFPIVSESYAASIGHVAIAWSSVEGAIGFVIRYFLGHAKASGFAITAELPHLASLTLLSTLIDMSNNQKVKDAWTEVRKDIEILRPLRNDIIHAEWTVYGDTHESFRSKARGSVMQIRREMPQDYLDDLAGRIVITADRLIGLAAISTQIDVDFIKNAPLQNPSPIPPTPSPKKAPRQNLSSAQKRTAHGAAMKTKNDGDIH